MSSEKKNNNRIRKQMPRKKTFAVNNGNGQVKRGTRQRRGHI